MPDHQQTQQSKKPDSTFQKQAALTSQPVSHPASIIQRARINPKSLTTADVLQLQRTIGNRAVGRLLSEIRNPSKVQQVPIQRQKLKEEETCPSCVQRQETPEKEEPLQGKFETIQRQEPEEEEKLQMKSVVQRQEIHEEDEEKVLQGKMIDAVQRKEPEEEEEPLQGVFENKPEQAACPSCIQRKELEEEEPLQTKRENNTGMPDNLKAGVESLSGIDMSDVRVHYNSSKPAEVGALAYTQGTNIHIASGQEKHLSHEAWHVVQQMEGRVKPTLHLRGGTQINDDVELEKEADMMGERMIFECLSVGEGQNKENLLRLEDGNVKLSNASTGMILQLKGTHFWKYLIDSIPNINSVQQVHKNMLITAWLLDQNIYDLENMLYGDETPNLENEELLKDPKKNIDISLNDIRSFLLQFNPPDLNSNHDDRINFFAMFVGKMPFMLTQEISTHKHMLSGKYASTINWMGLTPWGSGIGMELHMLAGGLPQGSEPSSDPVWMKTVEQHHPSTNKTTMYVRGHLLNNNIGGPGLDYNMVPITGKPATNVGANDANAEHLHAIEDEAKDTWTSVKNGNLREAYYKVVADFNRAPRPESTNVRMQEQILRQTLNGAVQLISKDLQKLTPADLQKELMLTQGPAQINLPPDIHLSSQMMVDMLALYMNTKLEMMTLTDLKASKDHLGQIIYTEVSNKVNRQVLDASTEGQAENTKLDELLYRVKGNADVWEAEDKYIPTQLHIGLRTIDKNNTVKDKIPPPVPIKLSTDVANVYYRPMKGNDLA